MIYILPCPDCFADNTIEADDPHKGWECDFCGNRATSSLPTAEDDYTKLIPQGGE